jgi:WD40 repeat protein
MKRRCAAILLTLAILLVWFAPSKATVESLVVKTLTFNEKPRDTAISLNGKWIYILTEKGEILIYDSNGRLDDTISVGKQVDSIEVGPNEEVLFLTSGKDKTVQILKLDFIREINISASPFKGKADAPVVIATFNDFQ